MLRIGLNQCLLLGLMLICLQVVESGRWTHRPRRPSTTSTTPRTTHRPRTTTIKSNTDTDRRHQHVHHWPPLVAPSAPDPAQIHLPSMDNNLIRLIDAYDNRAADGHYEYRYALSNGDTRYERAYWLPVGNERSILARRGYYSIPLPNSQYSTVFYTADHRGYHVDMHTLSNKQPLLPRSLEVPEAKPNSISNQNETQSEPEPEPEPELQPEMKPEQHSVDAFQVRIEMANEVETETETQPSTAAAAAMDDFGDDDDDDASVSG